MPKLGRKKLGADLSIIIPAAGVGKRMKSAGTKSLIDLTVKENVINRQIRILKKQYPKAEFVVVVGFQAEKIIKSLPEGVKIVENELYEETNVARSIAIALRVTSNPNILIVNNDLVFNIDTLQNLTSNGSAIVIDSNNQISKEEVGITIVNGLVTQFSYGLDVKWGQIVFLTGNELKIFKNLVYEKEKRKMSTFEILNLVLNSGGTLKPKEPKSMKIIEIDCSKDIEVARKIK